MYAITIFVPATHGAAVRAALAASGAGALGDYDSCSFTARGVGRFRPLQGARPFVGTVGAVEEVDEERIETEVRAAALPAVLAAVRAAHPYEAPAIHVHALLDWAALVPAAALAATRPAAPGAPVGVLVSGLDGVGKSTLCRALAAELGAVYLRTPPDAMRPFRSEFDDEGGAARDAYYRIGNALAGAEMTRLLAAGTSVVLDRYFPDTRAYALGRAGALPPAGDAAYAWPPGLPRPTLALLLTLPEAARVARRASRADVPETAEEALLRADGGVSARINEAFRRLGAAEVSAEGTPPDVLARVLARVRPCKA